MHRYPSNPQRFLRLMRYYPPFFIQRVIPLSISEDCLTLHVKIRRSLLTQNLWKSTFGGTLLAAIDPWYALLIWQRCRQENIPIEMWVERVELQFLRPGRADMYFTCHIPPEMWASIRSTLLSRSKGRYTFPIHIYLGEGTLCAQGEQTVYLRHPEWRPNT
ncbi:MAG: hypothetical protein RMK98_02005 [Bacteroidia bacterium]|nr:hypothetical protein [Bacteroidia bacterium]